MKKVGEKCSLADLKVGQVGKVLKLNIENRTIKRHMLDMGITRGVEILIKKIAPLGDPIDIKLRDYELAIRKADLKQVEVEVIDKK